MMTITSNPTSPRPSALTTARIIKAAAIVMATIGVGVSGIADASASKVIDLSVNPVAIGVLDGGSVIGVAGSVNCPAGSTWSVKLSVKQGTVSGSGSTASAGNASSGDCPNGTLYTAFGVEVKNSKGKTFIAHTVGADATVKLKTVLCSTVNGKKRCAARKLTTTFAGEDILGTPPAP